MKSSGALETRARSGFRLKFMRVIEANPEMSQREIASKLGNSLGGMNYAIQAFTDRGFVTSKNFRKSGAKVAYLFPLTPRGRAKNGVSDDRFPRSKA